MLSMLITMLLTPRWTILRPHPKQHAYFHSPHRFNTVPAGRRSGKTELFKRKIVRAALRGSAFDNARFFAGAPTRDQAKRIFWYDLKALSPPDLLAGRPSEGELVIRYTNGSEIHVIGMDKPERIEGAPWDGGGLDEYANMKAKAWPENVRPALSDRRGWCDFTGVPEGRNHYYELDRKAKARMRALGELSEWGSYHWTSAEILPAAEIEAARAELDPQTFDQEYNASFVNFEGRAYYAFAEETHCASLPYYPQIDLVLCFDFNVDPGVCAIAQEIPLPNGRMGTGVIGEVYIPRNSNTPAVCRKIIEDYGNHTGRVFCYGDATGGARGSAKVQGSDWELIQATLRPIFGERLGFKVPPANPSERSRINAVNTRLLSGNGDIHLMVDSAKAPHVVKDLEGVALLEGGSGELDKKSDKTLSHISDALGYYIAREFPLNMQNMN